MASVAYARLKEGATRAHVVSVAIRALDEYDRNNAKLLALVRDADEEYSSSARYFRMTLDAKLAGSDPRFRECKGYIVNYDVVADSPTEALEFAQRMEDGRLVIDDCEALEDRPKDPKGVYSRTERHYYASE